jgi:hypothetical protein
MSQCRATFGSKSLKLLSGFGKSPYVDVGQRDMRAFAGKRPGYGAAEPATGTQNERRASTNFKVHDGGPSEPLAYEPMRSGAASLRR